MFTVCPKCTLTLAVTANDLRVGQGYVRCGRCSNVFNALLKLSEVPDDGPAIAPAIPEVDPATTSQITRALTAGRGQSTTGAQLSAAPQPPAPTAPVERPTPAPARPPSPSASRATAPIPASLTITRTGPGSRAPAASSSGAPSPRGASNAGSGTDSDAIDQFETVLKTLGVDVDVDVDVEVIEVEEAPARPEASRSSDGEQSDPRPPPPIAAHHEPQPPKAAQPDSGPARTQNPQPGEIENIVLEGDEVSGSAPDPSDPPLDELDLFARRLTLAAEGKLDIPAAPSPPRPARASMLASASPTVVSSKPTTPGPRLAPAAATLATDADQRDGIDLDIPAFQPMSLKRRLAWTAGGTLIALLLLAAAVNHWRVPLASSPGIGPVLSQLYASVGRPIEPQWDLEAYEVRQQGAESEAGGTPVIRVRFSLANHAMRAQPVPLLRLTLLDRYGKRIGQRELTPRDYWPSGRAPAAFMASDERIDTSVQVRDPNADSASFELDVCLPEAHQIRCAGDRSPTVAAIP